MGMEIREPLGIGIVTVQLDSHGGEKQKQDEELYYKFCKELSIAITNVCHDEKYSTLRIYNYVEVL